MTHLSISSKATSIHIHRTIMQQHPPFLSCAFALLLAGLAFAGPSRAQETELLREIFSETDFRSDLPQRRQHRHRNHDLREISINPNALLSNVIRISIPGEKPLVFIRSSLRIHLDSKRFSWIGYTPDKDSEALFVVNGSRVTGRIRHKNMLHEIEPIQPGSHLMASRPQEPEVPEHALDSQDMAFSADSMVPAHGNALPEPSTNELDVDGKPVIDLLIVITPEVKEELADVGDFLENAIDEINQSFVNSQINLSVRVVGTMEVPFNEDKDMNAKTILPALQASRQIQAQRAATSADAVILITESLNVCGRAALNATPEKAYAVVKLSCAMNNRSIGHELGHLMGARHNIELDSKTAPAPYAHGYVNINSKGTNQPCFHTIMSYPRDCNPVNGAAPQISSRINYWSNPSIFYRGMPTGQATTANVARLLNENGSTLASFYSAGRPTVAANKNIDLSWPTWGVMRNGNPFAPR